MSDSIDKWMEEWSSLYGTTNSGGNNNTAFGNCSVVSGGQLNTTYGQFTTIEVKVDDWEDIENIQKLSERKEKIKKILNRQ